MNELLEKAHAKMLKEMLEAHSQMEENIHNWLCQQEDEELLKGVLKEEKSIKSAIRYCYSQASRSQVGGCAIIKDETVYSWVEEYFKLPVTVFKNEKAKTEKESKQESKQAKTPVNIQPIKKKEPVKMMEGEQLDLLDFL